MATPGFKAALRSLDSVEMIEQTPNSKGKMGLRRRAQLVGRAECNLQNPHANVGYGSVHWAGSGERIFGWAA